MSAEHAPGDVAMVTAYNKPEPYRAYFDGKTWREHGADMFCVDSPTSIRPLVVLDLDDPEMVVRAVRSGRMTDPAEYDHLDHALTLLADQIEAQTKPPRIPEPTEPLSEVEASTQGRERRRFVRGLDGVSPKGCRWVDGLFGWSWSELIDPVLIREGVKS